MPIAGKYRLTQEIAQGGCGVVYKGVHIDLDAHAERAIKVIRPEYLAFDRMLERFRREIQITSRLSLSNLNIVRVYDDFGEIPNLGYFYVMEYLEGQTLNERLGVGPLSLKQATHIFQQLCDAIQFAHEGQIIHRDLKPDNLLLIKQRKDPLFLKVLDFGIAKPLGGEKEPHLTQGALGTPMYMSPEQCLNKRVDARTDIYSMGIILYELLTGAHPFFGVETPPEARDIFAAHLYQSPRPVIECLPMERRLPDGIDRVLKRALSKNPDERYPTASAFEEAVLSLLSPQEVALWAQPVTSKKRPATPSLGRPEVSTPSDEFPAVPHETLVPSAPMLSPTLDAPGPRTPPANIVPATHPTTSHTPQEQPTQAPPLTATTTETPLAKHIRSRWALLLIMLPFVVGGVLWFVRQERVPAKADASQSPQVPSSRRKEPQTKPQAKPQTKLQTKPKRPLLPKKQDGPDTTPQAPRRVVRAAPSVPSKRRVLYQATRKVSKRHKAPKTRKLFRTVKKRKRPQLRRVTPVRLKGFVRYVKGCPRTPLFWSLVMLPSAQLKRAKPRLSEGTLKKISRGFCVGIKGRDARLRFGQSDEAFVPCTLRPAGFAPKVRIKLQEEGGFELGDASYCLKR